MQLFPLTSTFKEYLERPCNATGLHLPQHTWVKPTWLHKLVYIQGVEVYFNLALPILGVYFPDMVYGRYLLIYLNNICFSLPAFPLFRTWLCSSDSHRGCRAHGDQKSAVNRSCTSSGSCRVSAESPLGTMEKKTLWCLCSSAVPLKPASYT